MRSRFFYYFLIFGLVLARASHALSVADVATMEDQDQIVIVPRVGGDRGAIERELMAHGAHFRGILKQRERSLEKLGMFSIEVPRTLRLALLARMQAHPEVTAASPVYLYQAALVPTDPSYKLQYHHPLIGAPAAWDKATGSITIAILDTGVDGTHPDLAARMVPGFNFYNDNTDTRDVKGHGTAVAGTAAAIGNNGRGVAGVAWTAKIMPVRISDSNGIAKSTDVAAAIEYAVDHGARVINMSFAEFQGDSIIAAASRYAHGKGALSILSAGNSGKRNSYPGAAEQLYVAATDSRDVRTSFSTFGPSVWLAAPGKDVYTTSKGGGYGYWYGTSFAAPIVSGVAALCLSANPGLTPGALKTLLRDTAKDLGSTGYDEYHGYGRVDAAKAMSAVGGSTPPPPTTGDQVSTLNPAQVFRSPVPGSVLRTGMVVYWNSIPGASRYWFRVKDAAGQVLIDSDRGTSLHHTIRVTLPAAGKALTVQLRYSVNGIWYVVSAAYVTG